MAMNIKNILDSRFRKNDNKKESSSDAPSVSSLSGATPSLSSLGDHFFPPCHPWASPVGTRPEDP